MRVKLITYTPNPEFIVASAARLCYANTVNIETLMENLTWEKIKTLVESLVESGHASPLCQINFTFAIEGIDRATSLQLLRHHVGLVADQRSQRYVNEENFQYIVPKAIANSDMASEYESFMQNIAGFYKRLLNAGFKKEDARSILPNACETKLIITVNAQELLHIFNLRCCQRAQQPIRELANEMLKLCKEVAPIIFKNAGASCVSLGYCPEGKHSCGRAPTLKEVMEVYHGQNS